MDLCGETLLLVLVGLPARGKSYAAHKLSAYLSWRGVQCQTFNVGSQRRKQATGLQTSAFFSDTNRDAMLLRDRIALEVLCQALAWLRGTGGGVAILDATNTTAARRRKVLDTIHAESAALSVAPPQCVFLEMITTDPDVLHENMLQKVTHSPDFRGMPLDEALADLQSRIAAYERVYEHVDEEKEDPGSPLGPIKYVKLIDMREKVRACPCTVQYCAGGSSTPVVTSHGVVAPPSDNPSSSSSLRSYAETSGELCSLELLHIS
jgi:hypothetical protein